VLLEGFTLLVVFELLLLPPHPAIASITTAGAKMTRRLIESPFDSHRILLSIPTRIRRCRGSMVEPDGTLIRV
jgi:hypothetical protein